MIVEAPAKLNLTLEVTGVEPNGYHTLDTLFVWLDLHDTLELLPAQQSSLEIVAEGVSTALVSSSEENLVFQALRALEAEVGRSLPTKMLLRKRIPTGGGLGGGSADAAAALLGLRELHGLELADGVLHEIACRLGADVAFGLLGGYARGRRYGDLLQPLTMPDDLRDRTVVLLAPGFACPTPEVFRAWDEAPSQQAHGATERMLTAAPAQRLAAVANDLEPAAFGLYPQLVAIKARMEAVGLEGVCLSGSGSTMFGFPSQKGSLERVEKELSELGQVTVTKLRQEKRCG